MYDLVFDRIIVNVTQLFASWLFVDMIIFQCEKMLEHYQICSIAICHTSDIKRNADRNVEE